MKTGFFNSRKMEDFRKLFPNHSNAELASLFNLSIYTVKNYAYIEGLCKSDEYLKKVRSIAGRKKSKKYEPDC